MSEESYELLLTESGTAILSAGDETLWTSDGDEAFGKFFDGEVLESGDIEAIIQWLVDNEYLPPHTGLEVIDESETPGEDSGWFKTLIEDEKEDETP